MQFSYIALSPEYQRLTGVITAENEEEARKKLHAMGLSVISISEHKGDEAPKETETKQKTQVPTQVGVKNFYFKVVNSKGQTVDGTIESTDRKTAYKRLVGEYNFNVLVLCDASLPIEEREEKGKEGLEELAKEVNKELGITTESKKTKKQQENEQLGENNDNTRQREELMQEVDEVAKLADDILEKYENQLAGDEIKEIKDKKDALMRMRLSNNLPYIRNLTEELFLAVEEILSKYAQAEDAQEQIVDLQEDLLKKSEKLTEEQQGEEKYKSAIAFKGTLDSIRRIADRMVDIIKSDEVKKDEMEVVLGGKPKRILIIQFLKKFFFHLKGYITSKSLIRKKVHKQKIIDIWEELKVDWKEREAQKELAEIEKKDKELLKRAEGKSLSFCDEAKLFVGWLLSFYIIYFFIAYYITLKWGPSSPLFDFVSKSMETSFLPIIIGVLFIVFFGLSIKTNFARYSFLKSLLIFISTIFVLVLFLFNF